VIVRRRLWSAATAQSTGLAENPPADIELAKIGDLLNCDLAAFLKSR
jgi:hypothetical protein